MPAQQKTLIQKIGDALFMVFVGCFLFYRCSSDADEYVPMKARYNPITGLPINCRALIETNIDGYKNKEYSAQEALWSIERNCGRYGSTWSEK